VVESVGVGIAAVFDEPSAALETVLSVGPAVGWILAAIALAAVLAANYAYARKMQHA